MSRYARRYSREFRRQMVELVRAGRTPTELAREFEPTANAIRAWVKQAAIDGGGGSRHRGIDERGARRAPGVAS